jgi:hypothetical protein
MKTQEQRLELADKLVEDCTALVTGLSSGDVSIQQAKTRLAALTLTVDLLALVDELEQRLAVNAVVKPHAHRSPGGKKRRN